MSSGKKALFSRASWMYPTETLKVYIDEERMATKKKTTTKSKKTVKAKKVAAVRVKKATRPAKAATKKTAGKKAAVKSQAATAAVAQKAAASIAYNPQAIEKKWQAKWETDKLYRSVINPKKPKHYALTMLPYPSGDLHIGHWYAMTPSDARARFIRMQGYNVMQPMGFDAFGLPAENAAIKHGVQARTWTLANINKMRRQLRMMGAQWNWDREIVSCLPDYYKWTEWLFLQFYKHGLAYRTKAPA